MIFGCEPEGQRRTQHMSYTFTRNSSRIVNQFNMDHDHALFIMNVVSFIINSSWTFTFFIWMWTPGTYVALSFFPRFTTEKRFAIGLLFIYIYKHWQSNLYYLIIVTLKFMLPKLQAYNDRQIYDIYRGPFIC